jgi:polysaccharide biosynthesis protein PelF
MDDVCFILEGTYPFIKGGVSSWTHLLVEDMPDLKFSLLVLSPVVKEPLAYRYEVSDNVTNLVEVFLYNVNIPEQPCPNRKAKDEFWELFYNFLTYKDNTYTEHFKKIFPLLCDPQQRAVNTRDVIYSKESQRLTERLYEHFTQYGGCPFFDFFWTWRSMLIVYMQVMNMEIPPAKVYHAVCTGYAGLVGAIAKLRYNRPLLLTEHGIYTKERKIEINQADWIQKKERSRVVREQSQGPIKDLWLDNFYRLGLVTYEMSDEIYTLYSGNIDLEVEFGADPAKPKIIPNGVQVDKFAPQRPLQEERMANLRPFEDTRIVGLVGRAVSIKDIKMFIKVCKIVLDSMPNILFQVIGPTDEDPEYYQECCELVEMLGVQNNFEFAGLKNLIKEKTYATLDIMALTSISEGQPLTILEALCVGVPCVSTDVGSCSDLVYGMSDEDKALGECGYVVPIGNAEEFAQACLKILQDIELHKQMIDIGYQRIDKFYQQQSIVQQYKDIYHHYMQV